MANPMYPDIDEYEGNWSEGVPPNLDDMAPGPVLAAFLATVDVHNISGHDRVLVLRAHQRMASHYAGLVLSDMLAVAEIFTEGIDDDEGLRAQQLMCAAAEIRTALHLTRRSADNELILALGLAERHPNVLEALTTGRIDPRRTRVIVDGTFHLDDATAAQVATHVLDAAPDLTTGELRARIRKACIEVNPDEAEERYQAAVENRRVMTVPGDNGTAHLYALDLPPDAIASATRRIHEIAKSLRSESEERTLDQLCADVFLDLLNGHSVTNSDRKGTVDIRVDLTTLAELDDNSADLAGYGPVVADIARKVASDNHDSEWRYSVTDPKTGRVVTNGTTRRRPTAAQRRYLESVHPTCVFPGCRMPATECDMDHRVDYAYGGPTEVDNLAPLCRNDHRVKHVAGWTYRLHTDGIIEWTSPLGHTYLTDPDSDGRSPP